MTLFSSITTGLVPYFLKMYFRVTGDDDFEAPKSTGLMWLKSIRNSRKQTKKFKELIDMIENSNILLNKNDSKLMFLALKRLFYCCIRATDDTQNKKMKVKTSSITKTDVKEYELTKINFESEKKIDQEAINDIHTNPTNRDIIIENREPENPKFRYDEIIEEEGQTQYLQDELVKVKFEGYNFSC